MRFLDPLISNSFFFCFDFFTIYQIEIKLLSLCYSGILVVPSAYLIGGRTINSWWIFPSDRVASCWPLVLVVTGWQSGGPQLLSSYISSQSKLWRTISCHHCHISAVVRRILYNYSKERGIILEWNLIIYWFINKLEEKEKNFTGHFFVNELFGLENWNIALRCSLSSFNFILPYYLIPSLLGIRKNDLVKY